jgi:hypothetical protein
VVPWTQPGHPLCPLSTIVLYSSTVFINLFDRRHSTLVDDCQLLAEEKKRAGGGGLIIKKCMTDGRLD